MDRSRIILLFLGFFAIIYTSYGQSEVEVQLVVRKYVEKGSSVTFHCEHNVEQQILYKVTWLKLMTGKFFEYINGRTPPFRNFSIVGAEIDWPNSNEGQVTLKNLDFDAAGSYYCEVSTDTPIFTKQSQEETLHVILPQVVPPKISFAKRNFVVGEKLVANCTTSRARPAPHITWLINGKKVDEKHVRPLHHGYVTNKTHRPKSHQQQQQQQLQHQQHHQNSPQSAFERNDAAGLVSGGANIKGYSRPSNSKKELMSYGGSFKSGYENHHASTGNKNGQHLFGFPVNRRDHSTEISDNKFYEIRKHRNSFNGKYRRFVGGEAGSTSDNGPYGSKGGGEISCCGGTVSLGASGSSNNSGNGGSTPIGSGTGNRSHRTMLSSSQLSIEVSELHADSNGRLEITCLATIPGHIGPDEQFADYKTSSVKVDVEISEATSVSPSSGGGISALGNISSASRCQCQFALQHCGITITLGLILRLLLIKN